MPYTGRAARSGNSQSMAFEKALFRAHPEFAQGRLTADYIGPGTLLVRAVDESGTEGDDPVLEAYLAFLEREMERHPERVQPLSPELLMRAHELVGDIDVDLDADPGEDVTLP